MKQRFGFVVLAVLVLALPGAGDTYRPVSVSFFPPLSTNGLDAMDVRSNFSLNIIGGWIGAVEGAELGSVFNIGQDVTGFQGAGVFNITGRRFKGVQTAGVFSVVGESFDILQLAGVFNVVGDELLGCQAAGVANVVGNSVRGCQVAGVANVAGAYVNGAQLAGVINVAGQALTGAQLSGVVNVAGEGFEGAQIGIVNIAERARGLQLGIVNIAGEDDGFVPIGMVSIVEHGMFHLNAGLSEAPLAALEIKMGSRTVYNVFAAGVQPTSSSTRLMYGLGIGGRVFRRDRLHFDVDAVGYNVSQDDIFDFSGLNMLNKLRVTAGWRINELVSVTAGPTVSVFVSDYESGEDLALYDAPLYQDDTGTMVRIWLGLSAGVQLF
ncbi:MAG: hypothetical protein JSU73_01420 [candidate division WOR-3 bacterium]|nr:MAG: hypothetical protein JSU73_01420 [candidate division WOR-3 bacterium]